MNADQCAAAAAQLLDSRASGRLGARLPEHCRPQTLADAWQVQQLVTHGLMARNQVHVVAWKCALPGPGRLVVAPIYSDVLTDARTGVAPRCNPERVEPELAFHVRADLPARTQEYGIDEIDNALGAVHLAIEILDNGADIAPQPSFAERLAGGLMNRGLVLGPEAHSLPAEPVFNLHIDLGGSRRIDVPARHADGNPRLPLYWLANFLRKEGVGLRAGQWVITGSLAGVVKLAPYEAASVRFGPWGAIRLQRS